MVDTTVCHDVLMAHAKVSDDVSLSARLGDLGGRLIFLVSSLSSRRVSLLDPHESNSVVGVSYPHAGRARRPGHGLLRTIQLSQRGIISPWLQGRPTRDSSCLKVGNISTIFSGFIFSNIATNIAWAPPTPKNTGQDQNASGNVGLCSPSRGIDFFFVRRGNSL